MDITVNNVYHPFDWSTMDFYAVSVGDSLDRLLISVNLIHMHVDMQGRLLLEEFGSKFFLVKMTLGHLNCIYLVCKLIYII